MPKIITTCTSCNKSLRIDDQYIDKNIRCPVCKAVFNVTRIAFDADTDSAADATATASQPSSSAVPSSTSQPSSSESAQNRAGSESSKTSKQIGRYQVIKELGRGAFGIVFAAEDPLLKRQVAIKLQSKNDSSAKKDDVLREAQAAARLRHPNIVAVFEVNEAGGRPYVVSELIEGTTLAELIESGPVSVQTAATMIRDLAQGLAYAHSQGLIHRDIKPQNILVDKTGRPQITDFGLAVDRRDEQQANEAAYSRSGTLAYMAPEQAGFGGASVGPAVDQYALGATLFELLTSKRAHQGDSIEILKGLESSKVPRVRDLVPNLPLDLDAICAKAMAHDPWNRYENCSEFADDLNRYLAGDLIRGRSISILERVQHWSKRHPKLAPWAVAGGVTAASFFLISTILAIRGQFLVNSLKKEVAAAQVNQVALPSERAQSNPVLIAEQLFEPDESPEPKEPSADVQPIPLNDLSLWLAYSRKLNKAAKSLAANDASSTQKLLRETNPIQRHWEYGVLSTEADHRVAVWDGEADRILPLPDRKEVALITQNAVSVNELQSGKEIARWNLPPQSFHMLQLLGDQPVLVAGDGNSLRFWNYRENRELDKWQFENSVFYFRVSPDGKWLAVGNGKQQLAIWDISARKELGIVKIQPQSFVFDASSNYLYVNSTEGELSRIVLPKLNVQPGGNFGPGKSIFSPASSASTAFLTLEQGKVSLHPFFNVAATTVLAEGLGDKYHDFFLVGRGDKRLIAINRIDSIELIGPDSLKLNVPLPSRFVRSIAVTTDGRFLVACFAENTTEAKPRISIWSIADLLQSQKHFNINLVASSPDGSLVAVGNHNGISLVDQTTRNTIWSVTGVHARLTGIAFHPDGKSIASLGKDGIVKIWSTVAGQPIRALPTVGEEAEALTFAPDGSKIAMGQGAEVVIVNTEDGKVLSRLAEHKDRVKDVHFDSKGEHLASCGDDGLVALWDANSGQIVSSWNSPGDTAIRLAFTPDSQQLAVVVVPQQLRSSTEMETRTRTFMRTTYKTETRVRTVSKQVPRTEVKTRNVPYTEIVEQNLDREVEIECEGKKKKVKVTIKVPTAVQKTRTESYNVTVYDTVSEEQSYTVTVPVTTEVTQDYTVCVPITPKFKTLPIVPPGKPRVVVLNASDMNAKSKWIPEAGRIPSALQYTADGKRLLVATDRGISSLHPEYFFELLEHRAEGSSSFAYSEPLKQVCCAASVGLKWMRDASSDQPIPVDKVPVPDFLLPPATPAAKPVVDPTAVTAPAKPAPAKPANKKRPNRNLAKPGAKSIDPATPIGPEYEVDVIELNAPGLLTKDNNLILFAEPGERFQVETSVNYKAPIPTKLAANLLLDEAKILPPEFIAELMSNHNTTWHFDTESRPGYGAVSGSGTIKFELIGRAPREKGAFSFNMNAGLFDKADWGTKIIKFYPVILITDEQLFEQLSAVPQADRVAPPVKQPKAQPPVVSAPPAAAKKTFRKLHEIPPTQRTVALSDLELEAASAAYTQTVVRDTELMGQPLKLGGKEFAKGLLAHAPSSFELTLPDGWSALETKYGLQDNLVGSVEFRIEGDGKPLFQSKVIRDHNIHQVTIDIRGVKKLKLITGTTTDGGVADHSLWIEPQLHRQPMTAGEKKFAPPNAPESLIDDEKNIWTGLYRMNAALVLWPADQQGKQYIQSCQISRSSTPEIPIAVWTKLQQLKKLEQLDLSYSVINDTLLKSVGKISWLKKLNCWSTDVTDKGLASLEDLSEITFLNIGLTKASFNCLKDLKLSKIEELHLHRVKRTEGGLKPIRACQELKILSLWQTEINDADVEDISACRALVHLDLESTKITEKCFPQIARLSNLQRLVLAKTEVTDAAIADLKTKLPACQIVR